MNTARENFAQCWHASWLNIGPTTDNVLLVSNLVIPRTKIRTHKVLIKTKEIRLVLKIIEYLYDDVHLAEIIECECYFVLQTLRWNYHFFVLFCSHQQRIYIRGVRYRRLRKQVTKLSSNHKIIRINCKLEIMIILNFVIKQFRNTGRCKYTFFR